MGVEMICSRCGDPPCYCGLELESPKAPIITISNETGWIPDRAFTLCDTDGNVKGEFEVDEKIRETEFTYRPAWPEVIE